MDCLECGACAYVCPAKRPLVQHNRRAKAEIRRQMKK
jgi:electron transport complex protein RnfC